MFLSGTKLFDETNMTMNDPSQEWTETYGTMVLDDEKTDDFIKSVPTAAFHLPNSFLLKRQIFQIFTWAKETNTILAIM